MHIHTSASDGTWTPKQVVKKIKDHKIKLFAISDHDSVENVEYTQALAKKEGLYFIPAVEINSTFGDVWIHILAYGIDYKNSELINLLSENLEKLEKLDNDGLYRLASVDKRIDLDEFETYKHTPTRGGWRELNYMIDKGVCHDVGSFFALFKKHNLELVHAKFEHPNEVIKMVKKAGGVPVLAHPGNNMTFGGHIDELKSLMGELTELGMGGFECYHPQNSIEVTNLCLEWCINNDLMVTGGSDCHGEFEISRKLCFPDVRIGMLRGIEKLL